MGTDTWARWGVVVMGNPTTGAELATAFRAALEGDSGDAEISAAVDMAEYLEGLEAGTPDHDHDWADGACQYPTCDALVPPATFTLTIELGSNAMSDRDDVAEALEKLTKYLRGTSGDWEGELGSVRDLNGNTVGSWSVK